MCWLIERSRLTRRRGLLATVCDGSDFVWVSVAKGRQLERPPQTIDYHAFFAFAAAGASNASTICDLLSTLPECATSLLHF